MQRGSATSNQRLAWWQHDRFGMFIHWGLYTVGNLDCWAMHDLGTPVREYVERLEPRFTARRFDASRLMAVARSAGARYVVMGARHHEGYCLWNTDTTAFSSVRMTPGRDFIAEYVAAARAAGLKVGLYYSLLDWRFRAYWDGPRKDRSAWADFVDYVHAQVRELMTRYGKIDILWFDGAWAPPGLWGFQPSTADLIEAWRSASLVAMVRRLQPHIVVNNRAIVPGDYGTPEKVLVPEARPWELCNCIGYWWGASTRDRSRRAPRDLVLELLSCVSRDGNYLLNIGPRPDGTPQPWQARVMAGLGRWVHQHAEAVYGCGGEWQVPWNEGLAPWVTTRRGQTLYVHLPRYPGSSFGIANLHNYHLRAATLLDTGRRLRIRHEPTRDVLSGLPPHTPDPIAAVVKIAIRPKTKAEMARRALLGVVEPESMSTGIR
jgi:alpha-L-fucosidase